MDLSLLADYFNSIIVVIALLVGSFGVLNREAAKTLRETNKDLLDRVTILEANEKRNEAEISKLRKENQTLRTVITNEVRLKAIERVVEAHHKEAIVYWETITRKMDEIAAGQNKKL